MALEAEGTEATTGAVPVVAPSTARSLVVDTPIAKPVARRNAITRRLFMLGGFWSSVSLLILGVTGISLDFMWLKKITGFGGDIFIAAKDVPPPGSEPIRHVKGRFWLVNLEAGTTPNGEKTEGGLLALWQKCPHLGCTIPWRRDFKFSGRKGWFRCPCHGSTYTKEGGIIVAGPAPRPMDVFPIEVLDDLSLRVEIGRQFEFSGSKDNPLRAIPHVAKSTTPPPA
jgi:cytochrome b6-f complex iron-sulfur subunit